MYTDEQIMANMRRVFARRSPPFTKSEMRAAIARWKAGLPDREAAEVEEDEEEAIAARLRRLYGDALSDEEIKASIARWTQDAPGSGLPEDASKHEAFAPAAPWTKGMNGTAPAAGRSGRPLGSAANTAARAAAANARLRLRASGEPGAGRREARALGGTGGRLRA